MTGSTGVARRVIACLAGLCTVLSLTIMVTAPAHAEVSVIWVTNTNDSGAGSLREALFEAQATAADDEITFAPSVTGTISLTSGELDLSAGGTSGNLTIVGPGPDALAVDARRASRVLHIRGRAGDTRPTVVVSGLTLTQGWSDQGGAVQATGADLTLDRVVVSDSAASENGGGIAAEGGSLLITDSTITRNSAGYYGGEGGGIYFDRGEAAGAALEVSGSTISDNTGGSYGGGIRAVVTRDDHGQRRHRQHGRVHRDVQRGRDRLRGRAAVSRRPTHGRRLPHHRQHRGSQRRRPGRWRVGGHRVDDRP